MSHTAAILTPNVQANQVMATEDANGRMPTLQELKETHMILENDLKVLSDSYSQLQLVQDKFIQNIATISSFKSAQSGIYLICFPYTWTLR